MKVARCKVYSHLLAFLSCLTFISLSIGCGQSAMTQAGLPTPSPTPVASASSANLIFVTEQDSSTIDAFAMDASGAVRPVPGSPFAAPEGPLGLARTQQFLFVSSDGFNSPLTPDKFKITTFAIDPTSGALTQLTSLNYNSPTNLAVDPSGEFLYATTPGGVAVFAVGAAGSLTEIPGSPFNNPSALAFVQGPIEFHPSGRFLYSVGSSPGSEGTDSAIFASVNQMTGVPENGQMLGPLTGSLALTPDGRFMVAASAQVASQSQVCSYTIDPTTGAPSSARSGGAPVQPISCGADADVADQVAVDSSGTLVAVTDPVLSTVSVFRLSNGILGAMPVASVATAGQPITVTFSRDGKLLFVTTRSKNMNIFHVDAKAGMLTPASGSPVALSGTPVNIQR